jgi:hypothetical protein
MNKKKIYQEQCQFMSNKYPDIYEKMMKSYKEDTYVFFRFIVSFYIVIIPVIIFILYHLIFNNKESLFPICLMTLYIILVQYCYLRYCSNVRKNLFMYPNLKNEIYEEMVDHIIMIKKLAPIKKENEELNQIFINHNKIDKVSTKKRL